ncbi:hypothetical protein MASR1M90_19390 [Desulfovibrionales bacterium]
MIAKRYSFAEALRFAIWVYGKACTKLLAVIVPVTVLGITKDLPSTCIIVPNHQSVFDPYCMGAWTHHNIVFVVNNWPFSIPVYGPCMRRAGYLNKEKMDGETLLASAQKLLKQGVSVLIFPEGMRSRAGRLQRFHSGAFKLAMEADVPIVPLCIQGLGTFLPKGKWLIQPVPVRITALTPVYPKEIPSLQSSGIAPATTIRRLIKKQLQATLEQD